MKISKLEALKEAVESLSKHGRRRIPVVFTDGKLIMRESPELFREIVSNLLKTAEMFFPRKERFMGEVVLIDENVIYVFFAENGTERTVAWHAENIMWVV